MTAGDLMANLEQDHAHLARVKERDRRFAGARAQYLAAAAPVLHDLAEAGYPVELISDLRQAGVRYPGAIPTLVHWLTRIEDRRVRESIVRALSVPWARPMATPALIDLFRTLPEADDPEGTGLRWAIGNALEVLADKSVLDRLLEIADDRRYGRARQMVVLGLARPRDPRAIDLLVQLLDDPDVAGHAAIALGRLRAQPARQALERLRAGTGERWVRREAEKALDRLGPPEGGDPLLVVAPPDRGPSLLGRARPERESRDRRCP